MSEIYDIVNWSNFVEDVFYSTDYYNHLGTKRAELIFIVPGKRSRRVIHNPDINNLGISF